ncbi:hypothetical protein SuNHUV7_23630 (plasmid) [Pseudoseohaeicola sp. NH-UV-7]|uniref:cupin domain-containing protein n=1 Tax=unclassified Sulfitobacter TaxID=196795 RepID=UPI0013B3E74B|nr:cupin domain-containing protein [Sulfitobacter sp. JL08]
MALSITELLSDEEGQPYLDKSEVRLRVSNNDLMGDMAKISEATKCKLVVFVEFPAGFKSGKRVPDQDQLAVVLSGSLRISAPENEETLLGPGGIFRLPQAASSTHTLEAIGPEAVRLMVLQA